jgi:hypothetical protein
MSVLNLFALWSTTIRRRRHEVASDVIKFAANSVSLHFYGLFGWRAWSKSTLDASCLSVCMLHLRNYWAKFRWKLIFWYLHWKLRRNKSSGNALDLYSGGDEFESLPGHYLSWRMVFMVFPDPLGKCWDNTSVITRLFPSKSFQIHHSSSFWLIIYSLDNESALR